MVRSKTTLSRRLPRRLTTLLIIAEPEFVAGGVLEG
jgi:hypothetical protein